MFCELVGCNSETVQDAMDVVSSMNAVFSCFDELMDEFNVYKVETVGQIYMAVSGAPDRTKWHAQNVADLSLKMVEKIQNLQMPSGGSVGIRIGGMSNGVELTAIKTSIITHKHFQGYILGQLWLEW